eukprot:gene18979-20886_t
MASKKSLQMETKLNKLERKALRKQAKKLFALRNQHSELEISEKPTRHILISNGGLICGMERCHLLKCFGNFGQIEHLTMIPGRSYSLVSFKSLEDAAKAFREIHGQSLEFSSDESQKRVTLYLAYLLDSAPIFKSETCDVNPVLPSQSELHPPGLILITEFVSEVEEKCLIEHFKMKDDSKGQKSGSFMKHRKVDHFGYEFIYGKNTVDKDKPLSRGIPTICNSIIDKMTEMRVVDWKPDQLTVNQYEPGQDGREIPLILPGRSLIVMTGESRYLWTHGITPRRTDVVLESDALLGLTLKERGFRISLTFRKLFCKPCTCKYPEKCDSQSSAALTPGFSTPKTSVAIPVNESEAQELESKHVNDVYDQIADHFSDTRHSPWPKVAKFLDRLSDDSLVADVGCGNGKYLAVNKDVLTFGSDRSVNLVKICRDRGHCTIVCDILSLPYRSNSFDAAISIAVIHHLSTAERRFSAIKELVRIIKPDGLVLIYVWALEQNIGDERPVVSPVSEAIETVKEESCATETQLSSDVAENDNSMKNKKLMVVEKREVFEQQDLLVPWHFRGKKDKNSSGLDLKKTIVPKTSGLLKNDQVFHRFYHVFKQGELESLCHQIENVTIVQSYHDKGNWCIILKKIR